MESISLDTFSLFTGIPAFRHVITTRAGGVSLGALSSLNLGYHVGDDPAAVTENRRRVADAAGFRAESLVTAQQVHGTRLHRVTSSDAGRGALDYAGAIPATDGLIVSDPGIPVAIFVADCAPVLVVDPRRRVLAVLHAGWRGALGRIVSSAIAAMREEDEARPEDILVGIGPALCADCLEVGDDVGGPVSAAFGDAVVSRRGDKPHIDLKGMIRLDALSAGVRSEHIETHADCTRCRTDIFFSHRGQGGLAGRFGLFAWWEAVD